MKFLAKGIAAALIGLLATQPAVAWYHGSAPAFAPVGNAQINLGGGQLGVDQVFTNLWDAAGYGFFNGASADQVNSDGFPNQTFTSPAEIAGQFGVQSGLGTAGPYQLNWDAGVSCFGLIIDFQTINVTSSTNATTTPSAGSASEIKGNCSQAGSITYTINSFTGGPLHWHFDNSGTQPNYALNTSGRMWMCRSTNVGWNGLDDCTAYNNGIRWAPEFVNLLKSLKPQTIRTMGWNMAIGGQLLTSSATLWKYRGNSSKLSMGVGSSWPVTARAGGGPGFGTITGTGGQYTSPAATDTDLTGWNTNGEYILGDIQTAAGGLQISNIVLDAGSGNCNISVTTLAQTGTTNGTTTVALSNTSGVYVGEPVYGSAGDIPAGAVVLSIVANTSITMNLAATGSNSETITLGSVTGITAGQKVVIFNVSGTTEVNVNDEVVNSVNTGSNSFIVNIPFVHTYSGATVGQIAYQTLKITGKTGGVALPIVYLNGDPIGVSDTVQTGGYLPTGPNAFFYSSVTGHLHWAGPSTGISTAITPELQIQLANLVNANLWYNYGFYTTDDYITQLGTLFLNTANSNLILKMEATNEIWAGWQNQFESNSLGLGLGLFTQNTISNWPPYQAYRTLQVGQLLQPIFGGTSHPRFQNVYAFQAGSGFGNFGIVTQLSGSSLTAVCPTCNTFPNRPIDWVDLEAYAPYASAPGLADNSSSGALAPDTGVNPSARDLTNLQTINDNFIAGNTSTAYAKISSLFADGQVSTQNIATCSGNILTTASPHGLTSGTYVEFGSTGGTPCTGLNPLTMYKVSSTNLTTTQFSVNQTLNGTISGSLTAVGSAGTGTTTVGVIESGSTPTGGFFAMANGYYSKYQFVAASSSFSPPPTVLPIVDWYEGSLEYGPISSANATTIGLVTPSVPNVTTGTTHGTTVVDSIASVSNTFAGEVVSAADITASQTVVSVNTGCPTTCTGNYVVLSAVASGSNSGEPVTFTGTNALAVSTASAARTGWLNSTNAKLTEELYYNVFMGTAAGYITTSAASQSDAPSDLVLTGGTPNAWAMINGLPISSTPNCKFWGAAAFNGSASSGC